MQRSQVQYCDPFAQRPVDEGARAGKPRSRLSSNAPLVRCGRREQLVGRCWDGHVCVLVEGGRQARIESGTGLSRTLSFKKWLVKRMYAWN
jgi:hypothetical protein